MVLLGINAAAGNADLGRLQQSELDLEDGWWSSLRVKTAIAHNGQD